MLNKYPLWKYLLVLFVVLLGLFYAAPNLYSPDPALQITGESSAQVIDQKTLDRALKALDMLRPIAEKKGVSLGQLALAWVCAQPRTCAIAGARCVAC